MRTPTRRWIVFGVALVVQLIALYAPRAPSEGSDLGLDKLVHAGLFAAVVWTGARAGVPLVALAVLCAVHGPVSEILQSTLLPHRDGSWGDAVADLSGVAVGTVLALRSSRSGPESGGRDEPPGRQGQGAAGRMVR